MANLIITVIAILLVGVSAMMGAYYGGSVYLAGQQSADTSAVISSGAQLQGVWKMYLASVTANVVPTKWGDLISSGLIEQVPEFPPAGGGVNAGLWSIAPDETSAYWAIASLGQPVGSVSNNAACIKALTDAGVQNPVINTAPFSSATMTSLSNGNGIYGCYLYNGVNLGTGNMGGGGTGIPNGQYLFFYKLQ